MRITAKGEILEWYISPKMVFYKDGIEFFRFDPDICRSLQNWCGLSEEDSIKEFIQIAKNQLDDPSLEGELEDMILKIINERKN